MKLKIEVPDEIISNLLCSAFEGGSNYWLASTRVLEFPQSTFDGDRFDRTTVPLQEFGKLLVVLQDEAYKGKGCKYVLDREGIDRGLKAMKEKAPKHFGDMLAENGDADTGDVFLQCCLFGTVVYG